MGAALVLIGVLWIVAKLAKENYQQNQDPFKGRPEAKRNAQAMSAEIERRAREAGCSEEFIKSTRPDYLK